MKRTFDKKASPRNFQLGDIVLKWDKLKNRPGKHTKFDAMWAGLYIIRVPRNTMPSICLHLKERSWESRSMGFTSRSAFEVFL